MHFWSCLDGYFYRSKCPQTRMWPSPKMMTMTLTSPPRRCLLLGQHLLPKFLTAPSRSWGICSGGQWSTTPDTSFISTLINHNFLFLILIVVTINLVVTIKCHVVNVKKMFSASPLPTSQEKKKSLSPLPPPSYHMQLPHPPPPKSIYLLPTTPEPGSPSVGSVQWCQDESGFFFRAIRPILVKCKM